MKVICVSLCLFVLMMIARSQPTGDNENGISEQIQLIDPSSLGSNPNQGPPRLRRACDCWTTTGRCMPYGSYQCYFSGGASIVQCVGGNKWVEIGKCPSSCKSYGNDQPYCT